MCRAGRLLTFDKIDARLFLPSIDSGFSPKGSENFHTERDSYGQLVIFPLHQAGTFIALDGPPRTTV